MSEEYEFVYNHLEAIYIAQNTHISVMNIDSVPSFDYQIHLNIDGNVLSAKYTDSNSTNGVLTATHNFQLYLNKADYMSNLNTNTSYAGGKTLTSEHRNWGSDGITTLKDASVGVISKALFDNYGQRSAISDDMTVEDEMYSSINSTLTNIFSNDLFQDRIFRRYVASGRYDADDFNDVDGRTIYNLTNSYFRFGFSFYGLVNERDSADTLLTNSGVNIMEGFGFHEDGITVTNIQNTDQTFATYTDPAYQVNVLVQIHQNAASGTFD